MIFQINSLSLDFGIYIPQNEAKMIHQVTEGVKITVQTQYHPEQSNPYFSDYLFVYKIIIENLSPIPIQLLRRHWQIIDSDGHNRVIEGEGVVGKQPIIPSGDMYDYVSSVNLRTDIGKMLGYYTMENMYTKKLIKVIIPTFKLIAPFKLS